MQLRLLGPLELRVDGQAVPLRSGLPRKLLVTLALHLGERVSADTLIEALWGQRSGLDKLNALQVLVSHLRKALSLTNGAAGIETVEGGYRLRAARDDIDAYRLEATVGAVRHLADPQERLERLDSALEAWRGAPIPEVANEEFAAAHVQRLHELHLAAMELRIDALLALGRHGETVAELQHLVGMHPLRERFYAQLMTALYRSGRQAEALSVYDRARTVLVEELGLDPGPDLKAVEQAVLTQAPDLESPVPSNPPLASRVDPRPDVISRPLATALPGPLEPLIGREGEVARLAELMVGHRLMTLIGPGGAGKTRLAAELALNCPRPVWWIDLSPVSSPEAVLAALTAGCGSPTPAEDASALIAHLRDQDVVLVLDTCERVRGILRPFVESILRACPRVSVLATSRRPLGAATEMAWPVPPLSLPDPQATTLSSIAESAAVQLFTARAAHRRPDFALTDDNCADVARICLLLDGLPLAIELAAAHAGFLDPSTMVRVLDDRLRLLVDETRDNRQHTLRATIAWSYELLSSDEAAFFDRLSVFAGPFALEAAAAVAGDGLPPDGLELLLGLAQQSLVATDGTDRFRLLDTIRAYAGERLARNEEDVAAARRRHAAWYAELLGGGTSPQGRLQVEGWRGQLRDAVADLRSALDWCFTFGEEELGARLLASLWWLWPREGVLDEAAQWFPRAKELVPHGSALQADLLSSSGTYAVSRGDLAAAVVDCGAAAELYEKAGNKRSLAQVLIGLGIAQWGRGEYTSAARAHDRAVDLFAQLEDSWGVGLCQVLRARTAIDAHEDAGLERLATAEAAARRSGDRHVLAAALVQRARAEVDEGRYVDAAQHAEEALRLNEMHGHHEGAVGSLHALGLAQLGQGRLPAAAHTLARALRSANALHHAGATTESLDCLAILAAREDRWYDAALTLAAGHELRSRTGIRRSALMSRLIRQVEADAADRLEPAALAGAREQGAFVDVLQLAPCAPAAESTTDVAADGGVP
ncbi:Predicted ATPase [Geodermatophilus amargosae]|uniref:Predicted ATPase n=1 Tax=Geodermatophilus amargosae TaxID=1296565 RepID=A0A1I7D5M2_9ACTN|nr:BTAD domain-containing putative transcriptional regulator [Geodermatophilus amargosae]SFU06946.1 Predicted ATPase [Geodermatophilus amargosae]